MKTESYLKVQYKEKKMKVFLIFLGTLLLSDFCIAQKLEEDKIIGTFFSNLYSCDQINLDLSLVKSVPEEFYSGELPYDERYDVGWQLDFLKTGEIEMKQLFYMYCGTIIILEKGFWEKKGDNLYTIRLEGYCYSTFVSNNQYSILDLDNGIRILKLN